MIAMRLTSEAGSEVLMLVLEPGNLEKMKSGEPIHKYLSELLPQFANTSSGLLICYTPDAEWVAKEISKQIGTIDAKGITEILERSLFRPEVFVRGKDAEEMKRVI